ncbi:hypothetical protein [Roseibium sp. RKSG952]|uniref:hypothetical protein n=1 Tax=Roseibium sp. RKSG952 TaxID=2529384 RepID=UPI0012BC6BF9|nr:hypothetical protein [Roseibium sp. RKSG952]MTH95830.1 hypothetical protein [Roseibium sp. RKSG952]
MASIERIRMTNISSHEERSHLSVGIARPGNHSVRVGKDKKTGSPVWVSDFRSTPNILISASSRKGSNRLLSEALSEHITAGGGGFAMISEGDESLLDDISGAARNAGRVDHISIVDAGAPTNLGINPFRDGDAVSLTRLIVSLLDNPGKDGALWHGRAVAMIEAVIQALVWLRDSDQIELCLAEIRDNLVLRRIIHLSNKDNFPDMPLAIRKALLSYLDSLPGYRKEKGEAQCQTTLDQHGYCQMQFARCLSTPTNRFGEVLVCPENYVDFDLIFKEGRFVIFKIPCADISQDDAQSIAAMAFEAFRQAAIRHGRSSKYPSLLLLNRPHCFWNDGWNRFLETADVFETCVIVSENSYLSTQFLEARIGGSVATRINLGLWDEFSPQFAYRTKEKLSAISGHEASSFILTSTGETEISA